MKKGNRRPQMRTRQKQVMSMKARMVVGATCCLLLAFGIFISLNISNVENTMAATNGDYRSAASGNWEDAATWETFDGKQWQLATTVPDATKNKIIIKNADSITINDVTTINNIYIEKGGTLKLNAVSVHIDKGEIKVNGTIDAGVAIIDGKGKFTLADGASIVIGSTDGISKGGNTGNVQVTGSRYYSSFANYIYQSSSLQHAGKGLSNNVSTLIIDNPSGVILDNSINITSLLFLKKGALLTSTNILSLGTSAENAAILQRENGGIAGNFTRWCNHNSLKEILFPMMEKENYNAIYITINPEVFSSGTFTFNFTEGKPEKNQVPKPETRIMAIGETGYYTMTAGDGFEGGIYKLQSSVAISKHENKNYWLVKNKLLKQEAPADSALVQASSIADLKIFPNPFKQNFSVRFNLEQASEIEIEILNATGQLVHKDKFMGNESNNLWDYNDSHNLPPGIYFVNIKVGEKTESRKIIKS
jgi:hypothetical protein